jgi:Predicted ATP-binding protein involved in virulence
MKLNKVELHNFKCFEDIKIELHPQLNVLMGNNGTGKSSLLEAFRVLIGSLYMGYDKYENRILMPGITKEDIRLRNIDGNLEPQIPAYVYGEGVLDSVYMPTDKHFVCWKRAMESLGGNTTTRDAKEMQQVSLKIQSSVREGLGQDIPLVAYFSTDRYKKERKDTNVSQAGSRMRGYFNALDTTTSTKFFLDLYFTETLDQVQNNIVSPLLAAVNRAVSTCVNCKTLKYNLKTQELLVEYHEGEPLPFSLLSDGVRCMLAMAMEIAFRCYLLNPHLGEEAPLRTKGVVLIDEIDLHLHPSWQIHVLNDLRSAFPEIQFIVSTHAPLVVSRLNNCKIYKIADRKVYNFPLQNGRDANYILKGMEVDSHTDTEKEKLSKYFSLIDQGLGKTDEATTLRNELDDMIGG